MLPTLTNIPPRIPELEHPYFDQIYRERSKRIFESSTDRQTYIQNAALLLRALKASINYAQDFKVIVEVGCGIGGYCDYLAQVSPRAYVVGVDIDPASIAYAKQNFKQTRYQIGNVMKLDQLHLPKADLILAHDCLHHFPSLEGSIEQIMNQLKPGGVFWFQDLDRTGLTSAFAPEEIDEYNTLRSYGADSMAKFLQHVMPDPDLQIRVLTFMSMQAAYTPAELKSAFKHHNMSTTCDPSEGYMGIAIKR